MVVVLALAKAFTSIQHDVQDNDHLCYKIIAAVKAGQIAYECKNTKSITIERTGSTTFTMLYCTHEQNPIALQTSLNKQTDVSPRGSLCSNITAETTVSVVC